MPPIPKKRILSWRTLAVSMVLVLYISWEFSSIVFVVVVSFLVLTLVFNVVHNRRLRRIADKRYDENICTFAREFDRHLVDPWIIRAVYEGLQDYYSNVPKFPFRATDDLLSDLVMDEEDLDDLAEEIAIRIGRSMAAKSRNPLYGRVRTVRDLVMFYVSQPKLYDA